MWLDANDLQERDARFISSVICPAPGGTIRKICDIGGEVDAQSPHR
jgi:hypothetical protein